MANIAFLGLGAMGTRMAANLLDAGHAVTVWNRTAARCAPLAEKSANISATPHDVAQGAEFVLTMLRDDAASVQVWTDPQTGAFAGMDKSALAIECSTLSLEHLRHLADVATRHGLQFMDAPVAGSRPQAEAGSLIFFAGGTDEALARATPILSAMGGTIHPAGTDGAAMAIKLAVNTLYATQTAVMAELVSMLPRQGLDAASGLAIIGATPACSPAARVAGELMLRGDTPPLFPVELVEKDLGYAVSAAGGPAHAPVSEQVRARFAAAIQQGLAHEQLTAVIKTLPDG